MTFVTPNEQHRDMRDSVSSLTYWHDHVVPDDNAMADSIGAELRTVSGVPQFWCIEARSEVLDRARSCGLRQVRTIDRLVANFPIPPPKHALPSSISIRPLATTDGRPDPEELESLVAVNRRAFATHPDQHGMTGATVLAAIEHDSGTDIDGILVAIDNTPGKRGALVGFHWTRIRPNESPTTGEIHVLGVDPGAAPVGTGTALAWAGLADLHHRRHAQLATLWVEHDNTAAHALYRRLGFRHHSSDIAFERPTDERPTKEGPTKEGPINEGPTGPMPATSPGTS